MELGPRLAKGLHAGLVQQCLAEVGDGVRQVALVEEVVAAVGQGGGVVRVGLHEAVHLGELDLELRIGDDLEVRLRKHGAFVEDQVAGDLALAGSGVCLDHALIDVDRTDFRLAGRGRLADRQVVQHVAAAGGHAGSSLTAGLAGLESP